jgi:hypothetical protein
MMPTTRYFREQVLRKRPYLKLEWCQQILDKPARRLPEPNGRIRHWGFVTELGKWLRVVTLEDGVTVHNAFPDRGYDPKEPE